MTKLQPYAHYLGIQEANTKKFTPAAARPTQNKKAKVAAQTPKAPARAIKPATPSRATSPVSAPRTTRPSATAKPKPSLADRIVSAAAKARNGCPTDQPSGLSGKIIAMGNLAFHPRERTILLGENGSELNLGALSARIISAGEAAGRK